MRKALLLAVLPLALCAGAAAAAEPGCDKTTEITGLLGKPTEDAAAEAVVGRTAAACGRIWSAANLLERENARRSTPLARFNLAAAYARTGREAAAAALYRSVAQDGQRFWVILDPIYGTNERQTRVNLALEARDRAAELEAGLAAGGQLSTAAVLPAGAAGVDASAVVGGVPSPTTPPARISDAEALQRDGL